MKNLFFINPIFFLSILLTSLAIKTNPDNNFEKTIAKKAFITGITGQDGSYLTELLLEKGYEVHGLIRRSSTLNNLDRLNGIKKSGNLILHYGDVTDANNVSEIIRKVQPDEIYNLAAQSHVQISFSMPEYTSLTNALGTLTILEAIRLHNLVNKTKFYQASTSELFGKVQTVPQSETTPFYPRSPYGVAKLYAHWITINYRESYGIFACNGILFNHESPRRGENFVTRKITQAIAKIKYNLKDTLQLGNLDVKRDWGYAKDYVEAMWLMLQQEKPSDYVIATGENHTVREFLELAFNYIGEEIVWQGEGVNEIGFDKKSGKLRVEIDPQFFRPAEVVALIGDASKAQKELGWKSKTSFKELVELMLESDLVQVKSELAKRSIKKEKDLMYEY